MERVDYKNWMPKGMLISFYVAFGILFILGGVCLGIGIAVSPYALIVAIPSLLLSIVALIGSILCTKMYLKFSYDGERKLMKEVVEGVATYVDLEEGEKALDVGCGSGALTIALAKRNPKAEVIGLDRWGKEYASFSKALCENNAKLEGVDNVSFYKGNALKLPYEDETFDGLVSNYVYHNIPSKDRKEILLESLRVLKKGGRFAIHDNFSKGKYGDMDAFLAKLKEMGYERVELIPTAKGLFMNEKEGKALLLGESKLLFGVK